MRHPVKAFERHAHHYDNVSHIQQHIASHVVAKLQSRGNRIVDIGCGTGAIYRALGRHVEHFVALDYSLSMLAHHPKAEQIVTVCADFDTLAWEVLIASHAIDTLYSASSMQWSSDFGALFEKIYALTLPFSVAILTANTFNELHTRLDIDSPIVSRAVVEEAVGRVEGVEIVFETLQMDFASTHALLRYIQNSGVATTYSQVSRAKLLRLTRANTLHQLTFEVAYITRC